MGRTRHEADLTRGRKQLRELICLLRRAVVEKGKRWLSFCSFSGWFLKQKLGLDALRQQLLETALQGKETYEDTEVEVLRLFRDLHASDPLAAKKSFGDHHPPRAPLMQRFLAQQRTPSSRAPSSSAPSVSSFASGRSSSTYASSKPFQRKPFGSGRQAFVAERPDEEELIADEQEAEEADPPNLEEVLQAEAEILATEIEEAVEEGVESALLQDVEETVESAAEALLTMREARQKLAEVKKDRGYGKAGASTTDAKSKVGAKKASGKRPCFDCGQPGHWAGDPECSKPGAGLGRKSPPKKTKAVKVVETLNTEHLVEREPPLAEEPHEAFAVSCVSRRNRSLGEVLESPSTPAREVHAVGNLSCDKRLVGALDSACNRTVAGPQWLISYLEAPREAPGEIWSLVDSTPEREVFRFSDGGTQVSTERWRLPMVIGNTLMVFWTSVVPVPSLGLLLGRDFLESVGATMSFSKRVIKFDFLGTAAIPLKQLAAGHFLLRLIPRQWPGVGSQKWRKLGTDHVIELQVTLRDWLTRRVKATDPVFGDLVREHLLSERSLQAGMSVIELLERREAAASMMVQAGPVAATSTSSSTTPTSSSTAPNECLSADSHVRNGHLLQEVRAASTFKSGKSGHKVDALRSTLRGTLKLAFVGVRRPHLRFVYQFAGPLEASGHRDGKASLAAVGHLSEGRDFGAFQHGQHAGVHVVAQPHGAGGGICGGPHPDGHACSPFFKGHGSAGEVRSAEGGESQGCSSREGWHQGRRSTSLDWTSRRTSYPSRRPCSPSSIAQCPNRLQDDRRLWSCSKASRLRSTTKPLRARA